jgi:hypothetical protein
LNDIDWSTLDYFWITFSEPVACQNISDFWLAVTCNRPKSKTSDCLFLMTTLFNLDFHGTTFRVPKPSLFNLFEHQRGLFDATSYEVQSSVPLGIFEIFVEALKTGTKVAVTKENAGAISLLAKEFWLEDLLSECSALQIASVPEQIAALSERISKLEHQIERVRDFRSLILFSLCPEIKV